MPGFRIQDSTYIELMLIGCDFRLQGLCHCYGCQISCGGAVCGEVYKWRCPGPEATRRSNSSSIPAGATECGSLSCGYVHGLPPDSPIWKTAALCPATTFHSHSAISVSFSFPQDHVGFPINIVLPCLIPQQGLFVLFPSLTSMFS